MMCVQMIFVTGKQQKMVISITFHHQFVISREGKLNHSFEEAECNRKLASELV